MRVDTTTWLVAAAAQSALMVDAPIDPAEERLEDEIGGNVALVRRRVDHVALDAGGQLELVIELLERARRRSVRPDLDELEAKLGEREAAGVKPLGSGLDDVGERVRVVGRAVGGSATVTGHAKAKAKAGGGSFKAPRGAASASAATGPSKPKIGKAPSVLSAVSSRRGKFAN